jgi:hypothetical protein
MLHFTAVTIAVEEASVGEKLKWELQQHAGCSRDIHSFTGHERGLRKARL